MPKAILPREITERRGEAAAELETLRKNSMHDKLKAWRSKFADVKEWCKWARGVRPCVGYTARGETSGKPAGSLLQALEYVADCWKGAGGEASKAPQSTVRRFASLVAYSAKTGCVPDDWRLVGQVCLPQEGKQRSRANTLPPSATRPVAIMSTWRRAIASSIAQLTSLRKWVDRVTPEWAYGGATSSIWRTTS